MHRILHRFWIKAPLLPLFLACCTPPSSDQSSPAPSSSVPMPARSLALTVVPPELEKEILAGIKKVSDTRFEVTSRSRQLLSEHRGELVSSIQLLPEPQGDKVAKPRLFGVRNGGVIYGLGFLNGDIPRSESARSPTPKPSLLPMVK